MLSDSTSITLLRRALDGEQHAWEQLVGLYSPLIYTRCRRCGLDSHDAGDVTQNVFRAVYLSLPKFRRDRPADGFRRWLRTITRNAVIDHLRRQDEARAVGGSEAQAKLQAVADSLGDEQSLSEGDPDVALVVRQALDLFRGDYEEPTWQAFWRTAVEDQPAVDVARDLGLSPGAVRQAKYKILRRLKREFDDLGLRPSFESQDAD